MTIIIKVCVDTNK